MGAIVRLRDRYANDEISVEEFSGAVERVLVAETAQELSQVSPSVGPTSPMLRVSWPEAEPLQEHLAPGEEILWVGRPGGRMNLTPGELRMLRLMMPVLVILVVTATSSGVSVGVILGSVATAAIAWFFIIAVWPALRASGAVYAVTTRRLVRLLWRSSGEQMDSKLFTELPGVWVTERRGGRGSVTFGEGLDERPYSWYYGLGDLFMPAPINFVNITNATAVADLITSLQDHQQE